MTATKVVFISKDHRQAIGMDDDECSVESRLTRVDATPEVAQEEVSILTESTRESKAKAYAAEAVNEISRQYNGTIDNLNDKLSNNDAELADMKRQLDEAMKALGIVNTAKKHSCENDLQNDDTQSVQTGTENKEDSELTSDSDEEVEFEDGQSETLNSGSITPGRLSPLSLISHTDSSQNEVDNVATRSDDLDDSDSSNKLEKLLDDLSTDMDQNSDTSEPSLPHSPFRKKGETKSQYSNRTINKGKPKKKQKSGNFTQPTHDKVTPVPRKSGDGDKL